MYTCSLERMTDKINSFIRFGDAGNGRITRYSLSKEAIMARNEFIKRMKAVGAEIEIDDVADIYATLPGSDKNAKRIVMGSYVDTVKNGGSYGGILGVMFAMEVLETVAAENIPHKHPLTAMIWTNEEGSLYPPAMMALGIVCYDYLPEEIRRNFKYEDMMASKSILNPKETFGEILKKSGFKGQMKYRISPERYKYMFETNLEQEDVLEKNKNNIYLDKKLVGYVKEAAEECGISNKYMGLGAGHDTRLISYMIPTVRIFIQSRKSHCELEYSSPEYCTEGATVMLNAVLKADKED